MLQNKYLIYVLIVYVTVNVQTWPFHKLTKPLAILIENVISS